MSAYLLSSIPDVWLAGNETDERINDLGQQNPRLITIEAHVQRSRARMGDRDIPRDLNGLASRYCDVGCIIARVLASTSHIIRLVVMEKTWTSRTCVLGCNHGNR